MFAPVAPKIESIDLRCCGVEGMAQWLRAQAEAALGVPVEVELVLTVRPGPQVYRVVARG